MVSSDNLQVSSKQTSKDEEKQGSSDSRRKTASTRRQPPEETLKCPRCDSLNTKFCYFNNYSLTQPRHFCKTCRRYWTKGGALRSVPIGGGCRKNKKFKSSSSPFGSATTHDHIGGFNFFHGFNSPPMDFNSPPMDFNYPVLALENTSGRCSGAIQNNNNNNNNNIVDTIESLSCINQELHWKLQQQRLGVLFGNNIGDQHEAQKSDETSSFLLQNVEEELSRSDLNAASNNIIDDSRRKLVTNGETAATEWFFGNSYAVQTPPVTTTYTTPTNSNSNGNENATTWNNGVVQVWSTVLQQQNIANLR